jgi:PAS domain-containing protein
MEYPCHSPQQRRWFRLQAVAMQSPQGSVLLNHTDITEQKAAQEALSASEERYRSIVSALPIFSSGSIQVCVSLTYRP